MSQGAHLAIVPDGVRIPTSELTTVASALSKQVGRDFNPIWEINATVDSFATLEDVPTDYWPIVIKKDVKDAAGFHEDRNGQPYAIVELENNWSLTASHECLEMLADPFGNRLKAGSMLDQAIALKAPDHRVNYLVEVCDPCESGHYAYQVNGVLVSDFITPEFYDPMASAGVRYSFTGAVKAPRTVLDGGYISWQDPIGDKWKQLILVSGGPQLVDLSKNAKFKKLLGQTNARAAIDRITSKSIPTYLSGLNKKQVKEARQDYDAARDGQHARAKALRKEIARVLK